MIIRLSLVLAFGVLQGALAVRVFATETLRIGGDGTGMAVMARLDEVFHKETPGVRLELIKGLSSGGARKALAGSAIEIAVTSRPGQLAEKIDGAESIKYGRSPFVFATSTRNPVAKLSSQEIVDIYRGKIVTWANGERLRLILRPQTDSDTGLLKNMSPAMAEAVGSAHGREGIKVALTDPDCADAIQSTAGGFGTTSLAMILADHRPLKALSVDDRRPSPRGLTDGSYPWFKTYYISAKPDASAAAKRLVAFLVSARAKELLQSMGHDVDR